jgi:3-methylfumaryl-CoA hydratase
LLLDLLRRNLPNATVASFSFRALRPTFDVSAFQVCGRHNADIRSVQLWAQHSDGALAMDATAVLA